MNKKVPLWAVLLLLWFGLVITITFGWAVWHIEQGGTLFSKQTAKKINLVASFPSLVKNVFLEIKHPSILERPNLYPSINGFKMEGNFIDSNYILLSTYDSKSKSSVVKLKRIGDKKVIYQWSPNLEQIKKVLISKSEFWNNAKTQNLRLFHPLLSSDGSVVFHNYVSPLIKIDKNSRVVWIKNGLFHHSLEFDAEGNIWVSSMDKHSKALPKVLGDFNDEHITKISPDGELLFNKSITKILIENGYSGLMLGVGDFEEDMLHVNDIQPALNSGKYWQKGDLLISVRNRSTVFLYRPSTNKILWLKVGPWLHQHDVDFIDAVHIGIFGNNTVRSEEQERLIDGYNDQYIYNFETSELTTPYTEFFKKSGIATPAEGRSAVLKNGDLFVEETNNNRLLRGTTKKVLWQFVDRIDQNTVSALSWSRFVTEEEFKKLNFLKHN